MEETRKHELISKPLSSKSKPEGERPLSSSVPPSVPMIPPEGTHVPSPESAAESVFVSESDGESAPPIPEGHATFLHLNPRRKIQRKVMNIGDTNVQSHFASVARASKLQVEIDWTQCHDLAAWMTETMDSEE